MTNMNHDPSELFTGTKKRLDHMITSHTVNWHILFHYVSYKNRYYWNDTE